MLSSRCNSACYWVLALLPFVSAALRAADSEDALCDANARASSAKAARSELQKREYTAAAQFFQKAWEACPSDRALLLELSEAQAHSRNFQGAIASAQEFLKTDANSVPGTLALANAYLMAQRFADARAECKRALQLNPRQPAALKLKGNLEYIYGQFSDAESTFIGLLDTRPDDEEAAYMLGRIYYQEGRFDHAAGQFERVLKINPKSYKAYDNLGLCYQARGDSDGAVRQFLTAVKLVEAERSDYDWAYANLADLLLQNNDAQHAFAAASKAADRNPYSARNFYLGAKALCKLGKTELCLNWLQRSVSLDPNYPDPLYLLAKVYGQLGDQSRAKETLEKFRVAKAKSPTTRR